MTLKAITVLGCTGSIGVSTLEVMRQFPDRFRARGLAAGRNVSLLARQIREFRPAVAAVLDEERAGELREALTGFHPLPEILFGVEGYEEMAADSRTDMVLSAMVGAAGLRPTLAAVKAGRSIALANKETLVAAGELVMDLAAHTGSRILPVDSEHNAIFQALQGNSLQALRRILLTASGGPFFGRSREELERVTPEQALKHPNWSMGAKITIDSATLMNKGLEVIEACRLFDVPVDRIAVHIHPESIVHSMVEYVDGSVIAQLGIPDMKIPIAYALAYPERLPVANPRLDLFQLRNLSFYPPDEERFPCLRLAFEACRKGGDLPAVLNAANEVAVQAFLDGQLDFPGIPRTVEAVMDRHDTVSAPDLEAILAADARAREDARREILKRARDEKD